MALSVIIAGKETLFAERRHDDFNRATPRVYEKDFSQRQQLPSEDISSLRLNANVLTREHGVLASVHLQDLYDGKDISASSQLLEANGQQLADVMGLADNQSREEFLRVWRSHIREYENYTRALREGNDGQRSQARQNLDSLSNEFGNLTNSLIPSISPGEAAGMMREHIAITLSIVDAHAQGNTTAKVNQMKAGYDQAGRFADRLVSGITQR